MPPQEERNQLEKIVDAGSAVGTASLLFGSACAFSRSSDTFMLAIILADLAYGTSCFAGWLNEKRSQRRYTPRLYLGSVGICATIIDASYFTHLTYQYAVPGIIQMAESFF